MVMAERRGWLSSLSAEDENKISQPADKHIYDPCLHLRRSEKCDRFVARPRVFWGKGLYQHLDLFQLPVEFPIFFPVLLDEGCGEMAGVPLHLSFFDQM